MNYKKFLILNTIGTFALCFLTHFLYDWFPNPIFSIFFPVNESVWEHMKMLYTTILLFSIIEYFILKKSKLNVNNFLIASFIKSIISIPIYLIMFYPIFYLIGENMIVTFIILFLTILIVNFIGNKILQSKEIMYQKFIALIGIIIIYIVMAILTYKTPRYEIFFDTKEEKFGINDYLIEK